MERGIELSPYGNKQLPNGNAVYCDCEQPVQGYPWDDECWRCGYRINFKRRAKTPGAEFLNYNNFPKNWIT